MKSTRLYRSRNTRTHGLHHERGSEYRYQRTRDKSSDAQRGPMRGVNHGRDYTPLFKFLLSKVGQNFDAVFSEASARLDTTEPVFWMVARIPSERKDVVWFSYNSWYSGLYVDESGLLQKVNPHFGPEHVKFACKCCTHSFNGSPIRQPAREIEAQ